MTRQRALMPASVRARPCRHQLLVQHPQLHLNTTDRRTPASGAFHYSGAHGSLRSRREKLGGAVNGVFARAFKGDVQPVEITARLQRELDTEAKLLNRERRLVPNDFTVQLSNHDHDRLAPYSKMLNSEVIPQLRRLRRRQGLHLQRPHHHRLRVGRQPAHRTLHRHQCRRRRGARSSTRRARSAGPTW